MSSNLVLQRASAGSGKTYSLAKKYIWLYLTVEDENGEHRLRNKEELRDSIKHILAVTFTNKATTEMQERIVKRLFSLAYPTPGEKPDYQDDFCEALGVDACELERASKDALTILLENYSDFQVSTIDSFFQLVLRTFAFETDLNDSYAIELDSEYLSKISVDSLFEDIEQNATTRDITEWIDIMMATQREKGGGWNIFQKREKGNSTYKDLIDSLGKLQNEDFKEKRKELEDYFSTNPNLLEIYKLLCLKYESAITPVFLKMRKYAHKLIEELKDWEIKPRNFMWTLNSHANKALSDTKLELPSPNRNKDGMEVYMGFVPKNDGNFDKEANKKGNSNIRNSNPDSFDKIQNLYLKLIETRTEWLTLLLDKDYRQWTIYKKKFPLLGLLSASLKKRNQYLKEINSVELSETNILLHRVIGNDDTPFVYERLGTRLNHFLIDEFQDTSRLQWKNFKPLLNESLARGCENLLIGDAKQSIYRFRNADPSLISYKVEKEYGEAVNDESSSQNTNRRSYGVIVDFNNKIFKHIPAILESRKTEIKSINPYISKFDFNSLYNNVEQIIHKDKKTGFVQLNFVQSSNESEYKTTVLPAIINQIENILDRGFSLGEIAILVDKHSNGDSIIAALLDHNAKDSTNRKIEFISEESLKISSSPAVKFIVSFLQSISSGVQQTIADPGKPSKNNYVDWNRIKSNFQIYAMREENSNLPNEVIFAKFIKSSYDSDSDAIGLLLKNLQAITLPALVEGIVNLFIEDKVRQENALFISAFQDIILEYCEARPCDIASFVEWWEKKKDKFAISSPEGMDAVNIMTIHKAKGLEFPFVFVPFANCDFLELSTVHPEWKWVKPTGIPIPQELGDTTLPPYIPIEIDSKLIDTDHQQEYWESLEMDTMDKLNRLYVAFTRAGRELYIYLKKDNKDLSLYNIASSFYNVSSSEDKIIQHVFGNQDCAPTQDSSRTHISGDTLSSLHVEGANDDLYLGDYKAVMPPEGLKFKLENDITDSDPNGGEFPEETVARSEGKLLHTVMQSVKTIDDLGRSILNLWRKGIISQDKGEDIKHFFTDKIQKSGVEEWFDKRWTVINERPIVGGHANMKRPDRIMIDNEGNAVVVDFKFGNTKETKYYQQVKEYVEMLRDTGKFRTIQGWLWYVKEESLELVVQYK